MLTRRRFLGLATFGGIAIAVTGARVFQAPAEGLIDLELKNISQRHRKMLSALFAVVLNIDSTEEIKITLIHSDKILSKFDEQTRFELFGGLELLEQSPLWTIGSLTRFSALRKEYQIQVLKKWVSGFKPARVLATGLKEFCAFVYYSQDSSWAEIGYEGPWVKRS